MKGGSERSCTGYFRSNLVERMNFFAQAGACDKAGHTHATLAVLSSTKIGAFWLARASHPFRPSCPIRIQRPAVAQTSVFLFVRAKTKRETAQIEVCS